MDEKSMSNMPNPLIPTEHPDLQDPLTEVEEEVESPEDVAVDVVDMELPEVVEVAEVEEVEEEVVLLLQPKEPELPQPQLSLPPTSHSVLRIKNSVTSSPKMLSNLLML